MLIAALLHDRMLKQLTFTITTIIILFVDLNHSKLNDRLVLSPVELIDLVREEQRKLSTNSQEEHYTATENDIQNADALDTEAELCEDGKTLRNRKVWSRWSKWGACSVTCGSGVIARHRICVAGRCAHGEREEQRRPCARTPCASACNATDDLHDAE